MPETAPTTPLAIRLEALMRAKGFVKRTGALNQRQFEVACGLSAGASNRVLHSGFGMTTEIVERVASAMGVSKLWLAWGEGEMDDSQLDRARWPGLASDVYEAIHFARVCKFSDESIANAVEHTKDTGSALAVFLACFAVEKAAGVAERSRTSPPPREETAIFREPIGMDADAISPQKAGRNEVKTRR